MNKLFTENLPWKIASIVLAIVLWLFVINTQNPTQPQEISGVKINIVGLEQLEAAGYELSNEDEILNQNFKVVVNGPRLEVDKIVRNSQLVTATLDLSAYVNNLKQVSISDTANYRVTINVDSYLVTIKDKHPQVTKVIINKKDTKEQRLTYELDDSITKKYTLIGDGKPVLSPEKITISGKKTDIDRVSEAKVIITADNFSEENLVSKLPIILLDADGKQIIGLQMSQETAEVKLPIGSEKTVPVKVNLKGQIKEGYEVNTIVSPAEVTIVGKSETLAGIKEVELEAIDLSNLTRTTLMQAEIALPEGVITLEDNKVSVCLEITEEKSLVYPLQLSDMDITVEGIGDDLTYEIMTQAVNVELKAVSSKLSYYDPKDIKAKLNLANYAAGEYTLPLEILPPEGAKVVNGPINVHVRIKELPQQQPSTGTGDNTQPPSENPSTDGSDNSQVVQNNS